MFVRGLLMIFVRGLLDDGCRVSITFVRSFLSDAGNAGGGTGGQRGGGQRRGCAGPPPRELIMPFHAAPKWV
jgi:hypothetical protein